MRLVRALALSLLAACGVTQLRPRGVPTAGERVPAIVLRDQQERLVRVSDSERALLVFYRGHW